MIILFGPAGSGKSSQGRLLADKYGWKWLSVGQVLRETGKFDEILKNGELVDDKVVVDLMEREIARADDEGMDVILDGFPRDKKQAEIMIQEKRILDEVELAIVMNVPKEELIKRIEERGRDDDTAEVVERRLEIYESNIGEILPILEEGEISVSEVDGVGTVEEVAERIEAVVLEKKPDMVAVFDNESKDVIENDSNLREESYGE
ncbi:MAG: nucleoside monophosphate kinase [Candidatus Saccharibacteria bacterium]|nr:nucleoside monophosphate kinase [Candidatus Saccharibacteria bacterium]